MGDVWPATIVLLLMMLLLPGKNWWAILAFCQFSKNTNTNFYAIKEAWQNPEFVYNIIVHLNTSLPFAKNQNQIWDNAFIKSIC